MSEASGRRDPRFLAISDWLIDGALGDIDLPSQFISLCERMRAAGLPLLRAHLATRSLHPMFVASTVTWRRERPAEIVQLQPGEDQGEQWRSSPLNALLQSEHEELRLRLDESGAWRHFPMLVELQARGASDYFAQLLTFGPKLRARQRKDGCMLSWASDAPDGFSDDQLAVLRWLGSRFAVIAKLHRREQTALNVTSAYLGAEAGRRVLNGQIKLGDGEVIPAVIWYSDMRRSTELADLLPGAQFLQLLNRYFECTAGAVLDHGGEVLRFIGDAVLGIFHVDGATDHTRAARAALTAAREAERRLARVHDTAESGPVRNLDFGLGLHVGSVMFGNIGVPQRIEFSVVGPAANEVARLENLSKSLQRRILVSRAFADLLPLSWLDLGTHPIAGVETGLSVLAPPPDAFV
ncbi:MAG: adenylate/guanylate cyclase domain-containing protein [Gammaproteobacteria bacterium]|nr:adenylate/guanylate cyclase domain-containing protein [Gammaproteobacteria bacterium]